MPKPTKTHSTSAADFLPPRRTLTALRKAAAGCRGCPLYACATQTVFGEGPSTAACMMVGETPGDVEDREGRVFVGPAGKLLDRALDAAGLSRDDLYLTNAVKHFKWAKDERSKRRLHKTPNVGETRACFPWLENEIAAVKPRVIVCLGATAAKALLGQTFSVTKSRGVPIESPWAEVVFTTVHPSAVLRAPRGERRRTELMFVADLRKVARYLEKTDRTQKQAERVGPSFGEWPTTARRSATSKAPTRSSPA